MTTTTTIPILCYHAIEEGPGPLRIPPDLFRSHVDALRSCGAVTLSMADVARHIKAMKPFPSQAIALTFDDAVESVFSVAFPLLKASGFIATVYAVAGYLGGRAEWNADEADRFALMSSNDLKRLYQSGWEVGNHTYTHPLLTELDQESIADEVRRSSEVLNDLLGTSPRSFAYPYGAHDVRSRAVVRDVFDSCVTIGARKATVAAPHDRIDRIDAWYVRSPHRVRALHGAAIDSYLTLRRWGRALQNLRRPPRRVTPLA